MGVAFDFNCEWKSVLDVDREDLAVADLADRLKEIDHRLPQPEIGQTGLVAGTVLPTHLEGLNDPRRWLETRLASYHS